MCVPHRLSAAASCKYILTVVVADFHCDFISCELAQRGVRVARPRPAAVEESSECGRGNAAGLTSILDRGQLVRCSD